MTVDNTTGATIVSGGGDVSLSAGTGRLLIGNPAAGHIAIDNEQIQAKANDTTASPLYLNWRGGAVLVGIDGLNSQGPLVFNENKKPIPIHSDGICIQLAGGTDIDVWRETGIYRGENILHAPTSGWWYFVVTSSINTYSTIHAYGAYKETIGYHFTKTISGGVS